ncbi:hypothetical protein B9Z55_025956 [Caenorhabditis nigoni]|nr:hypothetical protein B9Z55_025956 [Caenorhabditis nigoni]
MAKTFRYRVWSPFLKYLNDPEKKFIDYFSGGTLFLRLKPTTPQHGSSLFEIVDIYKEKVPRKGTGFMLATSFHVRINYLSAIYLHSTPTISPRRFIERDSSEEPELRIDEEACDEAWNLPTSSTIQKSAVAPKQIVKNQKDCSE